MNCKHGIDQQFCSICTKEHEIEPLDDDTVKLNSDGKYYVLLRDSHNENQNRGFYLENQIIEPVSFLEISNSIVVNIDDKANVDILKAFEEAALGKGLLFIPKHPLTHRENEPIGPSKCHRCHELLDFESGSLGCSVCRYYACRCGACLCGYEGVNYLRQYFKQLPPLPISREDRLEYIRIVKLLKRID